MIRDNVLPLSRCHTSHLYMHFISLIFTIISVNAFLSARSCAMCPLSQSKQVAFHAKGAERSSKSSSQTIQTETFAFCFPNTKFGVPTSSTHPVTLSQLIDSSIYVCTRVSKAISSSILACHSVTYPIIDLHSSVPSLAN